MAKMISALSMQSRFDKKMQFLLEEKIPASIAVAVSGGPDSMLLCHFMQQFCAQYGVVLHAVIVDHKLRDNSSAEAEATRAFLVEQGVKVIVLTWDGVKPKANIQALARDKRYELIIDYCKANEIHNLVVGHHQDDQAETVLLRIMRGSGVDGIGGMDEASFRDEVVILRPMLSIKRSEIMRFINEIGWLHCNDPSNENQAFARIRVRHLLSNPSWSFIKDKLVLLARNARRASDYLHQQTESFLDNNCIFSPFGVFSVKLDLYKQQHEEIALRALALMLMRVSGDSCPPRLVQLERIYHALHHGEWKDCTLWGCFLKVRQRELVIIREEADIVDLIEVKAGKEVVWDNRFIINSEMDGYIKLLPKHRYHIELKPLLPCDEIKVSPEVIATMPIFYSMSNELVMVPVLYVNPNYRGCVSIGHINMTQPRMRP